MVKHILAFTAIIVLLAASTAMASSMAITEWMYQGLGTSGSATGLGEFMEFTNLSAAPIDMTGWGFDDNDPLQGLVSLSVFGVVAPGESVILTDVSATDFRTNWGLSSAVKVIGGNVQNLGRSDAVNLYDSTSALIDSLVYNDQGTGNVKGPRTQAKSANPTLLADVGTNKASRWLISSAGDRFGSKTSTLGEIANPGYYVDAVPEPSTIVLFALAAICAFPAMIRRVR